MNEELLSVAEAAELIGITRHGVRNAVARGTLRATEDGGPQPRQGTGRFGESGLRFTRAELLRYRDARAERLRRQLARIA